MLLLTACSPSGDEMRRQLAELERMNSADSLMTNDSLAESLAKYFDRHGTPNERMRAHYILGRTYADLGEAPAALESYLRAASCADTADAQCDYAKLSRVHAQSARVFQSLLQPRSQIEELRIAQHFAWKAHDTLIALECFSQTAGAYRKMSKPDSTLYILRETARILDSLGLKNKSARKIGGTVAVLLDYNDVLQAKHDMDIYETHSGFFDSEGNIQHGRELYYYEKGRYYLAVGKTDSAEYWFRRLLHCGYTLNHQIAASKGLQELYKRLKNADSIAKYAQLGYELNDSAYSLSEMEDIQRIKGSYNYNRNKLIAEQKTYAANKSRNFMYVIILLSVIVLLVGFSFFSKYRREKRLQLLQYKCDLDNLQKAQAEMIALYSEDARVYNAALAKKDEEIANLQKRVSEHRQTIQKKSTLDEILAEADIYKKLIESVYSNPPKEASNEELKCVQNLINECIPTFYKTFIGPEHLLSPTEYNVCMLVRLHFTPSQIGKLLGLTSNHLANIRKRILFKVFQEDGSPKDLDSRILGIV